ncbi:MAG: PEP/pyruvate-binding domain-containing protein [Chloroflexota bacterium]|nr:PEP/pyruvate-binding domain-containing protein [Chloroflexota bacterium]
MTYTTPFTQLGKNDIPLAGGKGANLGELTAAGFPVPAGFVLTTEAYGAFVNENGLQHQITELASAVAADDPQSAEEASAAIKERFLAGDMPEAIQIDLLEAYADLTMEGAIPVAVRSSATAEDLPTASFAGQQDTYLNIRGGRALLDAVKKCWASLWTARALSYRMRQDIDPATVSLAVVVQQFIPAESAGVLFTANPIDGERDQIVINATWGLGEAIVGGLVTPDTVVVDKSTWQIISRETTTKTVMTVLIDNGTEERSTPQSQQDQRVLDDATAIELARYGAQIEAHYGLPMDIEWAIFGGKIAILQARPITNLPPVPLRDVRWDPPRPGTIWMRRQVVEHMPEPLSPLFDELYLQNGLDKSMDEIGVSLTDLSGFEINVWDFVEPPFAATVNGYAYSIASFDFSLKIVPLVLRIYTVVLPKMIRHLVPRWRDESLPDYRAAIEHWKSIDLPNASDETLLQGVRELAAEDAIYWFAAAVPLGLARVTDAALNRFLKSVGRGRSNGACLTSGSFLRGFPSKAVEAQARLEAIARKIQASETLRKQVLNTPAPRLLDMLAEHADGQAVLDNLQQYLDAYGHQVYNLDFVAPTLADDPLPVLLSLQAAVAYPERDALARQAELAREREALVARTERSLNPTQRPIFRRLLGWAQHYSPYREEALFYVGAAWPALRRLALELGRRLTEAGSLDAPVDVFYLKSAELEEAINARADGVGRPDLASQARERRILREARKRLDPPVVVPPDGRMKFGPIDMAMFEPKSRTISAGPTLDGFAVSPGRVTAPASVIRSPQDFDRMVPDTILVCTTTTPAWTPLFARAKGLVTDIGGALAHGSIVAREYGIPAVMGTGMATQRIENGQRILVDGDAGTVTLLDEVDTEAITKVEETNSPARKFALAALAVGLVVGLVVLWEKRR